MHVKASVSARMSLVRLVQYSLVSSNCMFPFCWTNKWWWWWWWWWTKTIVASHRVLPPGEFSGMNSEPLHVWKFQNYTNKRLNTLQCHGCSLYVRHSTQIAQTSANDNISTENDSVYESDFGLILIRISVPDLSQNAVDALSRRRQSLRQVWYKSVVCCMRNANKCSQIPYSSIVKK